MTKKRILIVDDDEVTLIAFKKLFSTPNIEVKTVENIENALESLRGVKYDVVIADLRLTGTKGEEGLDILKYAKKHAPLTRLILITGYGNPDIRERSKQLGIDHYFEKPVSIPLLRKTLEDLGMEYKR